MGSQSGFQSGNVAFQSVTFKVVLHVRLSCCLYLFFKVGELGAGLFKAQADFVFYFIGDLVLHRSAPFVGDCRIFHAAA